MVKNKKMPKHILFSKSQQQEEQACATSFLSGGKRDTRHSQQVRGDVERDVVCRTLGEKGGGNHKYACFPPYTASLRAERIVLKKKRVVVARVESSAVGSRIAAVVQPPSSLRGAAGRLPSSELGEKEAGWPQRVVVV